MARRKKVPIKKTPKRILPPFTLASADEQRRFYWLLLAVAVIYSLSFGSVPVSNNDDQLMLTCAVNFTETGKLTAPSRFATKRLGGQLFGMQAGSGEVYAKYPPGYSVMLVPFVLLAGLAASFLGSVAPEVVFCLPSILALLATTFVLWRAALRLGAGAHAALMAALGFSLGSFAWPYAGLNWSEPVQALCAALSFYCLLAALDNDRHWRVYLLAGGCAMGFGILTRATFGVIGAVMVPGAFAAWLKTRSVREALARVALFAAPAVLASIYLLGANYVLTGSAAEFGYGRNEAFDAPLLKGLFDLTLGRRRGIIYFFPLILLAPPGFWTLLRRSRISPAAVLSSSALLLLLLISKWGGYEGGSCWGPRLLLPVVPFLALLSCAPLNTRWMTWIATILVGTGIAVNALGVLINYQAFQSALRSTLLHKQTNLDPELAQIPGHWWLLRVEASTPLRAQTEAENPLWKRPPWITAHPQAIPKPHESPDQPILNPWPLRALLPESRWQRGEKWYMRALLEIAIMRYEQGNLKGALEMMDRGLKIDPKSKQFLAAVGMVYYSLGDARQGLNYFDRALALDPDYDIALYGHAVVMEALGNRSAARASYERLLRTTGGTIDRAEIRSRLARLPSNQ